MKIYCDGCKFKMKDIDGVYGNFHYCELSKDYYYEAVGRRKTYKRCDEVNSLNDCNSRLPNIWEQFTQSWMSLFINEKYIHEIK